MPPRVSSPSRNLDRDVIRRIKMGKEKRKDEERVMQKGREEELQKEKEWEDSMVTYLEYIFNFLVAVIAASLPASETPPDYITAVVVLLVNGLINLMFRSTWIDRFILYTMNLILPASGDMIRRLDEVPGKMPPIAWLLFLTSNALLIALGYWYYLRKCKATESEFRQNVLAVGVIAVNITVGVLVGAISITHVLRWLNILKNILLHWTIAPN
eukprot:TRINITY_DN4539_c0_g1_i1.p1 TRINITY_DN4539_c0_g1~~TRINITY_DN4539_c0_g1_i1.p1  ORF type:complete len:213 (+),score=42.93 TRINITY_DN4539_c0_g1_i1:112-750(+)